MKELNIWFRIPFTLYWIGTETIKGEKFIAIFRKKFLDNGYYSYVKI